MLERDDYVFFWKTNEVHGWGSQWLASPFTAHIKFSADEDSSAEETTFPSAEHYMMVRKALLFHDTPSARSILAVPGVSSASMALVKSLGRQVSNFDEAAWVAAREGIVLQGNLLKFRQNAGLREKLLATGEKRIVEASPRDRIWGIGFGEKNALRERERWGLNLLGRALEETRRVLRLE
ncbi:DUF1768-domain-containing protein [Crassisporium funariophilum]|nr:DUF1768-domain-containing protein [Crassisporium funariophilum]